MKPATARSAAGGIALLGAPTVTIVIMLMHPTGPDIAADLEHMAMINALVHGAAIAALPVILFGLLTLSRRLGHPDAAVAGCVAYGLTVMTWTIAAVASGFLQTEIIRELAQAPASPSYEALAHYTWWMNQRFAAVGVVASCATLGLFGIALLRKGGTVLGSAGLIIGLGAVLLYAFGAVGLDVRGFGIIAFLQATWMLGAGVFLLRR